MFTRAAFAPRAADSPPLIYSIATKVIKFFKKIHVQIYIYQWLLEIIRKSLVEAKSCFNEQQTRQRDNFIRTVNWKCRKVTKSSLTAEKIFKERNQLKEKFGSLHIPSQWTKQWLDVFSMVMHFIFSVVVTIYSRACVRIRNDFDWWRCTRDIQKLHWMETLCEFAKLL